jgi:hypothetical protein
MRRALLVRSFGTLTPQLRKALFSGWTVLAYGQRLPNEEYDAVVAAFVEDTQREIEWVEEVQARLKRGGKVIRTT